MRKVIAIAALAALAACSPSMKGANERGGLIGNYQAGTREAFRMADEHCQQHGRKARVSGSDFLTDTMTFDCVEP